MISVVEVYAVFRVLQFMVLAKRRLCVSITDFGSGFLIFYSSVFRFCFVVNSLLRFFARCDVDTGCRGSFDFEGLYISLARVA